MSKWDVCFQQGRAMVPRDVVCIVTYSAAISAYEKKRPMGKGTCSLALQCAQVLCMLASAVRMPWVSCYLGLSAFLGVRRCCALRHLARSSRKFWRAHSHAMQHSHFATRCASMCWLASRVLCEVEKKNGHRWTSSHIARPRSIHSLWRGMLICVG